MVADPAGTGLAEGVGILAGAAADPAGAFMHTIVAQNLLLSVTLSTISAKVLWRDNFCVYTNQIIRGDGA
jgi:hypothetical protein